MAFDVIHLDSDLKPISYAWPGGYQVYYYAKEWPGFHGEVFILCPGCAKKAGELDYIITGAEINWEDNNLTCDECDGKIPASYS